MKTRLIYLFSISLSLVFASCSDDDGDMPDTQSPVINVMEPHEGDAYEPGGEIHFEGTFTDDQELASYLIEIHSDFDGHTHAVNKQATDQDNPWTYRQTFEIAPGNTSIEVEEHIDIPTEMNGEAISEGAYHFGIYLTDRAGNEQQAFTEIHIGHGDHDHDHDH